MLEKILVTRAKNKNIDLNLMLYRDKLCINYIKIKLKVSSTEICLLNSYIQRIMIYPTMSDDESKSAKSYSAVMISREHDVRLAITYNITRVTWNGRNDGSH